ncbi:hypothetical protein ACFWP3_22345 [Streptomyces sp. NPDC058525]|uniref:hypothetical protein n=1 Tax=unclassified Streptomyces TaxID=2593676 RepID=UPI0036558D39
MASRTGMLVLALAAAAALTAPAGPAAATPGPHAGPPPGPGTATGSATGTATGSATAATVPRTGPAALAGLARAAVSSSRYLREPAATAAGYVPDRYCVADPAGAGAVGYPHFNHAYDDSLDPAKPAALLYEDDAEGRRRLVALEWVVMDRDGKVETDDDRPSLFGQPFKGPIPGRFKGQKVHYALHVWLWKPNPAGLFATFNPDLRCRPGTTRP